MGCFHSHVQRHLRWKMWITKAHVPSWGWTGRALHSCFSSYCKHVSFLQCIWCHMFCPLFWWGGELFVGDLAKGPPSIALKCCLVVLSARRLLWALQRKSVLDQLRSDTRSMSVNQQYMLTNAFFNRNTHKNKVTGWMVGKSAARSSHRSRGSVLANSVPTTNNKNWL